MRRLIFAFVFALFLGWSMPAKAWGDSGHRTVCEIAFMNLTPTARAEVRRLFSIDHPIFRLAAHNRQFGWACTYPDHPLTPADRRGPLHFVNYARTLMEVTAESGCGQARDCVVTAIASDFDRLRSTTLSDSERLESLIYLGHWFGDIHQPLHSSYRDDEGGNELNSNTLCTRKFHSTWDTCMLEQRIFGNVQSPDVDVVQTLAANWNATITADERRAWAASAPWQWSGESYAFAIRPDIQYCIRVGPACQYDADRLVFAGAPRRSIAIDDAYMIMALPIIEGRIKRAGIRLATFINRALDPGFRG